MKFELRLASSENTLNSIQLVIQREEIYSYEFKHFSHLRIRRRQVLRSSLYLGFCYIFNFSVSLDLFLLKLFN